MSDEPKWTPGPWVLLDGHKRLIIVQPHKYIESGVYVAEVSLEAWRPEERKETATHDARLIAAAPELYAALDWIMRYVEDGSLPAPGNIKDARAALAKARGEV